MDEIKKQKHREAQQKYRDANKNKIHDYNIKYNQSKKETKPIKEEPTPTPININEILTETKTNKRTKKNKTNEIIPSFKTRDDNISQSSINDYIAKCNIIHRIFTNKTLSKSLKVQLINLFNNNDFDEDLIKSQMPYITGSPPNEQTNSQTATEDHFNNGLLVRGAPRYIEPVINTLRTHYKNDNTFKSYLNILVVITSHLKTLDKNIYQTLTKLNIYLNEVITDKRKENKINKEDENKIIDLSITSILTNIRKLDNINEKLIYALYSLFPARRLEWRLTKLIIDDTPERLDPLYNYLITRSPPNEQTNNQTATEDHFNNRVARVGGSPLYEIIFNNYKTASTYGRQIFNIDNIELTNILNEYINKSKLSNGDFLFSLKTNKKKEISQSNFSQLISNIYKKVYNIPISIRFLRMSHITSYLSTNPTIKQMEILAYKMAHSKEEQGLYKKIKK
jgi:hypothetical protein